MRNIILVVKNILKRIYKKPSSYLLHFLVPIIASVGLFMVFTMFSESDVYIGVSDQDNSEMSRAFIRSLDETDGISTVPISIMELSSTIVDRNVSYGINISMNFERKILANELPTVEVVSLENNSGVMWISGLSTFYVDNMMLLSTISANKSELLLKLDENADKYYSFETLSVDDASKEKAATVSVFGTYMIVLIITTFTIAYQILIEKEKGTFSRIGLSPVHPKSYILANIIANFLIVSIQIAIVMSVLAFVLNVNFYTNPLNIYFIVELFALCSISVGVLIATLSKDIQTAGAALGLIVSPSCMLGGCLWPLDSMPEIMRKIAYLTPQRWTLDAILLIQRSDDMSLIIPNLLVVLGFTTLFFLISVSIIKNEDQLYN